MEEGKKLKPFNRDEVETLIRNKNWKALREYDLRGADFRRVDLAEADLHGAVLRGADFTGADLTGADLRGADLHGANLTWACLFGGDLHGADLTEADFHGAVLRRTDFTEADLHRANFNRTDLHGVVLHGADFTEANLYRADFTEADLAGADLTGADFYRSDFVRTNIDDAITDENAKWCKICCPEEGEFIGYKKAFDSLGTPYIVKLRIPAHALRSSATSEKCRCSEEEVVSITDLYGEETDTTIVYSAYDQFFAYRTGEIVKVNNFCEDRWQECAPGIHFFMEREKAVDYDF